jgi:HD-GYP domain-containing protein (c-di-GMP phosphodiesterase class II)
MQIGEPRPAISPAAPAGCSAGGGGGIGRPAYFAHAPVPIFRGREPRLSPVAGRRGGPRVPIGKIAIPDAILLKPGALTEDEQQVMRTHPVESERIIARLPGLCHLGPAVRAEHERYVGLGYPEGLTGEAIPLASRITLVCDAYHAMVSDRPYRAALTLAEARQQIAEAAGTQFCPRAAHALLATLPR